MLYENVVSSHANHCLMVWCLNVMKSIFLNISCIIVHFIHKISNERFAFITPSIFLPIQTKYTTLMITYICAHDFIDGISKRVQLFFLV